MKKISWRFFVSFSVVLLVFAVLIGLMFTRFNRTNIVGAYRKQLSDLGSGVAKRTRQAQSNKEGANFGDYLKALEDFGQMQNIDIWIVSNPHADNRLSEDYTNMDISRVLIPAETQNILESAYDGKKKAYSSYDDVYQRTMLHLSVPIREVGGDVIGAVLVAGPMEMQENTIIQYEKYMAICVAAGFIMALAVASFLARQMVRPIIRIKEAALILASGQYDYKTGIKRKDELGSLAESMDTLSDRLVEAREYQETEEQHRRDFFSNVSHELRTPIAVVKGYADTLTGGYVSDPDKQREYLSRIQRECGSMERLVSDLLILSRMQNPDYEMNMETINVIAVAQDSLRSIRILMREKNLTGSVEYNDACSLIEGDYERIRQVFTILLQNAVKYSYEGTEITVSINREDGMITAAVRDFGSVIPEEEWDSVFQKFYRASNHGANEGSGLGLVVAQNIVLRHGGEITVTSSEKEGTCFLLKFPETSENFTC